MKCYKTNCKYYNPIYYDNCENGTQSSKSCIEQGFKYLEYKTESIYRDLEIMKNFVAYFSQTNIADTCYISKLEYALKKCISALYEAFEIAPLDRLPQQLPDALQEAQATLDLKDSIYYAEIEGEKK